MNWFWFENLHCFPDWIHWIRVFDKLLALLFMKVIASMLLLAADASRIRRKVVNEQLKNTGSDPTYQEWAGQYGFNSDDEKMAETYQANLDTLAKVMADHPEAEFGVNQFYGMSWDEFSSTMLTVKPDTLLTSVFPVFESSLADLTDLADEVDWDVTPVKDQGTCGSCWAFAAMASIEHGHKVKTGGTDVSLAEQQLMDCSGDECQGGWPPSAMDFLKDSPIYTTQSYPYKARKGSCQKGDDSGVRIYGHIAVDKSESALLQALQIQAITVGVNGDEAFGSYKAGVIDGTTVCDINHAVAAT